MNIDFNKMNGLVPAIIQDAETRKVLMLGFMNKEAYEKTVDEKRVTFYSRTKQRLWTKGEESGNFFNVVDIKPDCDNDTLLVSVNPVGPACHTGADTCFFDDNKKSDISFLVKLQEVIQQRKREMPENSYTTRLFSEGINKIAQKVGEEGVELVIEALNNNDELFLNEAADLIFHFLVLLTEKNKSLEEVVEVLKKRHGG